MKLKIFFIAVLFFHTMQGMDDSTSGPKKRRTELEDLNSAKGYICEAENCTFYGTYQNVANHERKAHKIYRTKKKAATIPLNAISEEPVHSGHEEKEAVINAHAKKQIAIADSPLYLKRPYDRELLATDEITAHYLAPLLAIQASYERNFLKKKAREDASQVVPNSIILICNACKRTLSSRRSYIDHTMRMHQYGWDKEAKLIL